MNRRLEPVKAARGQVQHTMALAMATLAAFGLRVWLLGAQNIWWDEGLAIWAVRQGWVRMTLWTASDVHPPFYFWLLRAWVSLAGESEFAARFISLVCGMVSVAALYPLGKALLGQRVALGATLLLAFSRFHVWWSQEMRMYIVATMWGVLSLYMLLRWFQTEGWMATGHAQAGRQHPVRQALLYIITTAAGLYTLYLFLAILLIENVFFLWLLLRQQAVPRRSVRHWVLAQLAVLMLFAPWLVLALPRMRSWSVAEPFDFTLFLRLYATLLTLGISTHIERYAWLVLPFFLIIGAALACLWRSSSSPKASTAEIVQSGQTALLLSLFLVVPPGIVYALTRPRGLFYAPRVEARYLILFGPAFCLLLAWSVALLYRQAKWLGLASLAIVAGIFVWTLPGHYTGRYLRDEHQTMVRVIAAYAQQGDGLLLVSGNRYPIFEYCYGRLPQRPVGLPVYALPQHALQISQSNLEQELAPLAARHSRLWLAQVDATMQDPQGLVQKWLAQRYTRILDFGFAHNALTLFAPAGEIARMHPDNLAPRNSLAQSLGSGHTLLGYDLPTYQFRPGDTVHLALYYASEAGGIATVRMVDKKGRILEQREAALLPANPIERLQLDFTVYTYSPAGLYHFEIDSPDASSKQPLSFGRLRVAATHALPKAGVPAVALSAMLEDGIEFVGYALTNASGRPVNAVRAGETLMLDLYWRARHKVSRNYTVFAHFVGQAYNPATAGPLWAGHDSQPLAGGYPTRQWFVDETVIDRHVLTLDPQAPSGEYELEVGMYLLETMARLPIVDAQGQAVDERIVLGHVRVQQ